MPAGRGADSRRAGGGAGGGAVDTLDPHSLKQRVDTLYHRILKAEVDARLHAEIDKRESLERDLRQRAAQAGRSSSSGSDPPPGGRAVAQRGRAGGSDRQRGSASPRGAAAHRTAITTTAAAAAGAAPRSHTASAKVASASGGRENAFQALRRGGASASSSSSSGRGERSGGRAAATGPIVRQFRHKHEIVRDAEAAARRVVRARERLATEREKCAVVDAEHAEVAQAVHASKQKIKALITLIRSLALSRTTQKIQEQSGALPAAAPTPSGGDGGGGGGSDRDAAQIIDDHLDTILDLLPQYERKAQRVRSVIFNDLEGGAEHVDAADGAPSTIDDLLETVQVPGANDAPAATLIDAAPTKQAFEQQYATYLRDVFTAELEATSAAAGDSPEKRTHRALANHEASLADRQAQARKQSRRQQQSRQQQQQQQQPTRGGRAPLPQQVSTRQAQPPSRQQRPQQRQQQNQDAESQGAIAEDEWLSALGNLRGMM